MRAKNFERIMEGLNEAVAHARGEDVPGMRIHIPAEIDSKAIRKAAGNLTQAEFAERYGFSLGAVRDWEQGRAVPDQSTRAFLKVIAAMPAEVERVLSKIVSLCDADKAAMSRVLPACRSVGEVEFVADRASGREALRRARKGRSSQRQKERVG